ncbi:hypothetical protein AB0K52_25225 [Glycomyces sp. NPDC049804]|uniref:hypothetical protein n=1 Tax=Glycomyces sp. NPDC049804 TaxID=3154363 RepID=UPI00342C997A
MSQQAPADADRAYRNCFASLQGQRLRIGVSRFERRAARRAIRFGEPEPLLRRELEALCGDR